MATRTLPQYEGGRVAYCQKCGLWITVMTEAVELKFCPRCEAATLIEACRSCGASLPVANVRTEICIQCGEKLSGPEFQALAATLSEPSPAEVAGLRALVGDEGENMNWLDLKRTLFARYVPPGRGVAKETWAEIAGTLQPHQLESVTVENIGKILQERAESVEKKLLNPVVKLRNPVVDPVLTSLSAKFADKRNISEEIKLAAEYEEQEKILTFLLDSFGPPEQGYYWCTDKACPTFADGPHQHMVTGEGQSETDGSDENP